MKSLTLWRKLLYKKINEISIEGDVIDLGGSRRSGYHELISGNYKIIAVNIDKEVKPDLEFNLEEKFPIINNRYNAVLCINVLEHIFNYENILDESYRILKDNGQIIIAVPFLFQIHASPHDYWRFSGECLKKILKQKGFRNIEVKEIGYGVFSAASQLKYNAYRFRLINKTAVACGIMLDKLLKLIKADSFLTEKNYPLGYFVIAKK